MLNWTYCVVGNIRKTHKDETGVLHYGTKPFPGGTRVYLYGRSWDRGREDIVVLGLSRRKRLQAERIPTALIENVRCRKVFNPAVLHLMDDHEWRSGWWGKSKAEKEDAEAFVQWWNQYVFSCNEASD